MADYESQYKKIQDGKPKNEFPATLDKVWDILSDHKFDPAHAKDVKDRKQQHKEAAERRTETVLAQQQWTTTRGVCHCCGVKDKHYSPDCPKKDKIPYDKWWINKAVVHYQNATEEQDDELSSDEESVHTQQSQRSTSSRNSRSGKTKSKTTKPHPNSKIAWNMRAGFSGMQFAVDKPKLTDGESRALTPIEWEYELQQRGVSKIDMKDWIIIDCGSTMKATFCNPNFLTEVRKSSSPVIMRTNAGHRRIELEGDMPGFGTCHYDPNFIANILGFNHLAEKYRVTFDNGPDLKKRVFYVYTENGIVEFTHLSNRLYGFFPSKDFVNAVAKQKNMLPPPPPTPPTSDDDSSYYSTTDDESECDDSPPPSLANHNLQECDSSSDDSSDDEDSYSPPIARKRNKSGNNNNNSKVTTSDAASKMLAGGSFTQNHVIATVEENEKFYTKRQVHDAKRARKLYHIIGMPNPKNYKYILYP